MKITKLILARNKRLSLKNINYIEINPSDLVQLILGTNGVGKSTLIFECTPLPALKDDYYPDGYKEIHSEKDGNQYVCKSEFSPKQRHSFYKNGENLNEGGTIGVQKELVVQEFGMTQEAHEIITMQTKFTTMPVSGRRYWMTKMANSDFNYVIGVYNKLKTKHNEISGAVKTLKKRLVLETEKIVDIDYQNALQKEVDELHATVSQLLEIRKPVDETPEQMTEQQKTNSIRLTQMSVSLIRNIRSNRELPYLTHDSIEAKINEGVAAQQAGSILSDRYLSEISKLDESISALEKTGQNNVQDLLAKILRLQMEQNEVERQYVIPVSDDVDPEQVTMALSSVEATLFYLADNLPVNSSKNYSREQFQITVNGLTALKTQQHELETSLKDLQARQKHQELHLNTEGVECPQCRFKWHLGYSEEAHTRIKTEIETKSDALREIAKSIEETQKKQTEILEYFAQFKRYTQLTDNWKILKDLWEYFIRQDTILSAPANIRHIFTQFSRSVQLKGEHRNYQRQIDEARELINLAEKVVHLDIDKLKAQREELDAQLFAVSQDINKGRVLQNEYMRLKNDKISVDNLTQNIEKLLVERSDILDKSIEATRRTLFNDCVRTIQSTLSRKELAIQEIRGQRAIIVDIEHQIRFLTADEQALKLLVDQLSPTDGLIAEGIFGFIKVFVNQWNAVIKKIWSYPLVVQACDMDDEAGVDLTYKFPVDNGAARTPDVSRCSAGQKEVIDLGFMILFMKHSGFADFPLMLDEFAVNLDNTHRISATNFIKELIEKHSFTQLFMVNHYDSIYGAFTNAQVTVMDESNIILPKDCVYNKHAIIR